MTYTYIYIHIENGLSTEITTSTLCSTSLRIMSPPAFGWFGMSQILLERAKELGSRLLPAFQSPSRPEVDS